MYFWLICNQPSVKRHATARTVRNKSVIFPFITVHSLKLLIKSFHSGLPTKQSLSRVLRRNERASAQNNAWKTERTYVRVFNLVRTKWEVHPLVKLLAKTCTSMVQIVSVQYAIQALAGLPLTYSWVSFLFCLFVCLFLHYNKNKK